MPATRHGWLLNGAYSPAEEKALAAEKRIAIVRLAVILFNVGTYYLLLPPRTGIPWLAAAISVVAVSYGFFVVFLAPYRWWPVLRAALFTALTDGVLIVLWVAATGGFDSPFHLLWLLSMMAVAFRYEARATLIATVLYIVSYLVLLALEGTIAANAVDVTIRCSYIGLAGMLGALLAHDSALIFEVQARTAREIAERRSHQETLELKRLRDLDRFKTDFINAAAHELNTPLTPLRLQVHMLQSPGYAKDTKSRSRAMAILARNVERMALLVEDMLDVARMQSGHVNLRLAAVDVAGLAHEAVDTYHEPAKAKNIKIQVEGPESLMAVLDGKRASQILYNLVSNAIKYSPKESTVTVRYGRREGDVMLSVSDEGLGFTPEQRVSMFRPFSQAHRDQVTEPGTGLGLFISRGIAARHGGTLDAQSPGPGKGSTFTCVLPDAPQPSSAAPA